jgi:hypothetical protein
VSLEGEVVRAADFRRARENAEKERRASGPLVEIAGRPYELRGRLGRGASTEVYWGDRATRLVERVVVKILRVPGDGDLMIREWTQLAALHESGARGLAHFARLVAEPVAHGVVHSHGRERPASVFLYKSGFVHTLADVRAAYPRGVDPRHAVWIWRRILEILAWVHASGFYHGAVLPEHVLLHARDHGAMLIGWSASARLGMGAPVAAVDTRYEAIYPAALLAGAPATDVSDMLMTARCVAGLLGDGAPAPLVELLRSSSVDGGHRPSALELHDRVGHLARSIFGPPEFVPFNMPCTTDAASD